MTPSAPSSRVERRRAETRARIVHVAAQRFAAEGLDGVRLDAVATAADVARGTLYNHFPSKDSLLLAVMEPVLHQAASGAEALVASGAQDGVDGLLGLYLDLWRDHRDALRVTYHGQAQPLGSLEPLHGRFLAAVLTLLQREAARGQLRTADPLLSARILGTVAVPLLEGYEQHPAGERLFRQSVRGLLVGDCEPQERVAAVHGLARLSPTRS